MTVNNQYVNPNAVVKGNRLERIRRAKAMLDAGFSHADIRLEMGLTRATLSGYIEDFCLLDEARKIKNKPPPSVRSCLHCRGKFKPDSTFRFMCNTCNNFARGAMI